jgi:hypothetical protein
LCFVPLYFPYSLNNFQKSSYFINCKMAFSKILLALPIFVLQILGVGASFEDVVFPRDAELPLAFQDNFQDAADIVPRAAPAACSYALDALEYCSSVSPGFLSMAVSKQAPCLCYSALSWDPGFFDNAVQT